MVSPAPMGHTCGAPTRVIKFARPARLSPYTCRRAIGYCVVGAFMDRLCSTRQCSINPTKRRRGRQL